MVRGMGTARGAGRSRGRRVAGAGSDIVAGARSGRPPTLPILSTAPTPTGIDLRISLFQKSAFNTSI